MRKVILYISLIFPLFLLAQIQEETFNATTIPPGWIVTNSPNGCHWYFGFTDDIPGSGFYVPASMPSGAALFIDETCDDNGYNVTLTGPAVNLVSLGITRAEVQVIFNHQTFSNDGNFFIEVWNGSSWKTILFVDGDMPPSNSGENQTSTIDVTNYINSNFRIRFLYDDENVKTFSVAIDNYTLLNTGTTGIEDLLSSGFSYSPNPVTSDELNLTARDIISSVTLYNNLGQKVFSNFPSKSTYDVPMYGLSPGIYIVQVAIGEKQGTFKVIKQ